MKNLMKSEVRKIFFLKSSRVYLLFLIVLSLILGLIFSLTTNVTQRRGITELSPMDVLSANLLGVDLANIMLIVFTALTISRDFSTKLIVVSLVVTPNRKKYFFGKLITILLLSVGVSIVVLILNFSASQLILSANNMPGLSLLDLKVRKFVLGVMTMPVFYTIITAAATFLFNSGAGAITFSLGTMAFPALVKLFPDSVQSILLTIFPQSAIHSLAGVVEKNSAEYIGIITSIFVLLVWIAVMLFLANIKFHKQDIQ